MKIAIKYLENELILKNDCVTALEILNKNYFYRVVKDLYSLYIDGYCDDITILDESEDNFDKIKIFVNYFDLGFDTRKNINDIAKYVNKNITEKDRAEIIEKYQNIIKIYSGILNNFDISLKLDKEIDIDAITKLMKISINYKDNILDNMLLIIDVEKVFNTNNLLIFINLKQYLTKNEITELYKYAIYNEIKILLIDSQRYNDKINHEKKYIIDEELEEFELALIDLEY